MKKILVVDDEPMVLRGISLILEKSYLDIDQILSAENGIEALFSVEKNRLDRGGKQLIEEANENYKAGNVYIND